MAPEKQAEMPFYDSPEDATYSAILRSRKRLKEVALALWPTMKADSAYARLVGSLKGSRPEKLTTCDHVFIANYTGEYDWLYYCEAQCHHAGTRQVAPEDEQANLQRLIVKTQQELTRALNQYNALRVK